MKRFAGILLVLVLLVGGILAGCGGTAEWYVNQGNRLAEQGSYDEAIEEYTRAIELDPQLINAYFNRGFAYHYLGQFELAIEDYDEAIRLYPQYAEAYFNRGLCYRLQGKSAEAIADFEKFITLTDNLQWIEMARQQIEELSES